MSDFDQGLLRTFALLAAGLIGAWTSWACYRAHQRGIPGGDAAIWAGLAAVFFLYAQVRFVRALGWLDGWGGWLRTLAREHNLYSDRRMFQVYVSIAIAVIAIGLLLYGLIWFWHYIKRYRLAIGFAAFAVGYALIRFVSLHEVDAWNAANPWAPLTAELIAAVGASAVAVARLHQLKEFARLQGSN